MIYDDPVLRDVFRSGVTPLAMAAVMGNISAATTLIKAGANVDYFAIGKTGSCTMGDLADKAGATVPGL